MHDVPGQEVDVVVLELDARVAHALAPQLVELGVLDPLDALRRRRLVQVELQHLGEPREVAGVEGHHVLRHAVRIGPESIKNIQNLIEKDSYEKLLELFRVQMSWRRICNSNYQDSVLR